MGWGACSAHQGPSFSPTKHPDVQVKATRKKATRTFRVGGLFALKLLISATIDPTAQTLRHKIILYKIDSSKTDTFFFVL